MCLEARECTLEPYGQPEIFNTDQGSLFTRAGWGDTLASRGINISINSNGQWVDHVFIERWWHSLKYEGIYLYAFDAFADANAGIDGRMTCYNSERPLSSLGYNTSPQKKCMQNWQHNMMKPGYTLESCQVVRRMGSASLEKMQRREKFSREA